MLFIEMLARRPGVQVPPPTALNAAVNGTTGINLSWTNANGTLQTDVWKGGVFLATVAAGTNTYADNAWATGVEYTYQVRHRASATSFSSFTAAATQSVIPPAPNLTSGSVTEDDVTINWSAVATAQSGYSVLRSTSSGSGFVEIGTTGSLTYTDLARPNGTYYYAVRADNGTNESVNSNEYTAAVSFAPPLDPPTSFTATATHSDRIALAWTNGGAYSTEIYRGTSPSPTTLLTTASSGTTSYNDENLTEGTTYYYRIRHISGPSLSTYVSDDATLAVASLTGLSLAASTSTEQVTLAYTITNPPFAPTIDVGAWEDTDRAVDVAARTNVGASPITIATYSDIVPAPTGTTVTGTLAYIRLKNGLGATIDQVNTLTVDFDYGAA